jgi:hypothetical protein
MSHLFTDRRKVMIEALIKSINIHIKNKADRTSIKECLSLLIKDADRYDKLKWLNEEEIYSILGDIVHTGITMDEILDNIPNALITERKEDSQV